MITYSNKTRLAAACAVLAANTYETRRKALDHWNVLIDYDMPKCPWIALENEVVYVEGCYGTLRETAREYRLEQRLVALESRIEDLEAPNGGLLGSHR